MRLSKRPRFLLDLAEELTWLNQRAGPDVAEHWYQSLQATMDTSSGIRIWAVSGAISSLRVSAPGE